MTITETTTVGELASAIPASVRVLQRYHIDFCCGGKRPIGEACREHGVSFLKVIDAIADATAVHDDERDWQREPLPELISHIVTTFHDRLYEDLPRLEGLATKAAQAHAAKGPGLARLRDVLIELSDDLLDHMRKEELVLFPAIGALATGERGQATSIGQPISVIEQEHEHAGALLAELGRVTDNYGVPEWACPTVRALYQGLQELERSMHVHVHLENNILFPRALALSHRCAIRES